MVSLFSALALAASPDPVVPELDAAWAMDVNRAWRGVGIGYDNGLWGSSYGQSVKVDLPFGAKLGQFVGLRVRGIMTYPGDSPIGLVGGEIFGRSPVYAGIVRVYGGGGAWYGGAFDQDQPAVAWGGHSGVEVALTRRNAFTFEVGGQAPADGSGRDAGASVMAGTTVYLGSIGR